MKVRDVGLAQGGADGLTVFWNKVCRTWTGYRKMITIKWNMLQMVNLKEGHILGTKSPGSVWNL